MDQDPAEERDLGVPVPRRDPLWARLVIAGGTALMVLGGLLVIVPRLTFNWVASGITQVQAIPSELIGENITGPINFLMIGIDERDSGPDVGPLLSDSIILVHIPASHDQAYMISVPRDTLVNYPYYPSKINASFAVGATKPNGERDTSPDGWARGAARLMKTLSGLVPDGLTFNGAAIINFQGFQSVIQALGGVHMCVDEDTYSIRHAPDGTDFGYDLDYYHAVTKGLGKHYPVGCYDMQPWEALDFSRQRELLPDGDFGRQRHQQQLMVAVAKKIMSTSTLTNFGKLTDLKKAAGDLLTLDLGGHSLEDWVFTLSSLRPESLVPIKTYGGDFRTLDLGGVSFQRFDSDLEQLLESARSDTVADFLLAHPTWVADPSGAPLPTSTGR